MNNCTTSKVNKIHHNNIVSIDSPRYNNLTNGVYSAINKQPAAKIKSPLLSCRANSEFMSPLNNTQTAPNEASVRLIKLYFPNRSFKNAQLNRAESPGTRVKITPVLRAVVYFKEKNIRTRKPTMVRLIALYRNKS